MQMNTMWVPLIASIGVGAATYYTVSKNNQNFNQALQEVLPVVSHMSNGGNSGSGTSFGNNANGSNLANNSNDTNMGNTQQLGPYGMS